MGVDRTRWEAIWLLRRGEYGYAGHELTKLVNYVAEEYRNTVAGHFGECNYTLVADLLQYRWEGAR